MKDVLKTSGKRILRISGVLGIVHQRENIDLTGDIYSFSRILDIVEVWAADETCNLSSSLLPASTI